MISAIMQVLMENAGRIVKRGRADAETVARAMNLIDDNTLTVNVDQAPPEAGGDRDQGSDQDKERERVSDPMKHIIFTYLKKNRKPAVFYLFFLTLFLSCAVSVRLCVRDALSYAVFLSLVTFLVLGVWDLWRYVGKVKCMDEALRNMPYELGELPAPQDVPEEKYQEEIRILGERIVRLENDAAHQQTGDA